MRIALLLIVALATINGVFSPMWIVVFALQGLWLPAYIPTGLWFPVTLSVVLLAIFYLLVSGVPAALSERLLGQSMRVSRMLWLAAMLLMSWPSLSNIAGTLAWH
jgi:hypothetical protein